METEKTIVATVSMFELLSGGKSKFTNSVGLFKPSEALGEVLEWARLHATESGNEMIKVELSRNARERS